MINFIAPALLFFIYLPISGCTMSGAQSPVDPSNAPLRDDAVLDFLKPDGSVITSVSIEIAETPENISKGLMWRTSLDITSGMLFIFQESGPQTFWMRNTPLRLDILFIGKDSCIKNIAERTSPMSDQTYNSKGPVKYVLEVRGGFSRAHGIKGGHCVRWRRHIN